MIVLVPVGMGCSRPRSRSGHRWMRRGAGDPFPGASHRWVGNKPPESSQTGPMILQPRLTGGTEMIWLTITTWWLSFQKPNLHRKFKQTSVQLHLTLNDTSSSNCRWGAGTQPAVTLIISLLNFTTTANYQWQRYQSINNQYWHLSWNTGRDLTDRRKERSEDDGSTLSSNNTP